jgi:uncharacterized protein involved in outer membrane biogenesis
LKKAALAAVAIVVVSWWRRQSAGYVKDSTGRDFTISGPVTLSFFPWLGGVVKTASLA